MHDNGVCVNRFDQGTIISMMVFESFCVAYIYYIVRECLGMCEYMFLNIDLAL